MNDSKKVFISGKTTSEGLNIKNGFAPRYDDNYLNQMSTSAWGIVKNNRDSTNAAKLVAQYYKDIAKLYKDSTAQLNPNDNGTLRYCQNHNKKYN